MRKGRVDIQSWEGRGVKERKRELEGVEEGVMERVEEGDGEIGRGNK